MNRSRDCRFSVNNFEAGTIDPDLFEGFPRAA